MKNIPIFFVLAIVVFSCKKSDSPIESITVDPNPTQIIFFGINDINSNQKIITTNVALRETLHANIIVYDKDKFDTITVFQDGSWFAKSYGITKDTIKYPIMISFSDSLKIGKTVEYKYVFTDKLGFSTDLFLNTTVVK